MFTESKGIITSLLDTDLYKFTMQQVVLHRFQNTEVEYAFKCRNGKNLVPFIEEIRGEIEHLCKLTFTKDELAYLGSLEYLKPDYIAFLDGFKLNSNHIKVYVEKGELSVRIKGPWFHTILFEVPVLAIINEVYCRNTHGIRSYTHGRDKLNNKIQLVERHSGTFNFVDFGTRRRFSKVWQDEVVKTLSEKLPHNFVGTSNVYLGKKYGLKPTGTMAHEFLQASQALGVRLIDSQKFALENWVQEYRGQLGVALSDVVGVDAFLRDFDLYFAKLYDGARHDSGDPYVWGDKLINHYKSLGIDPKTKLAVFSDGLDIPKALDLANTFNPYIQTSFGIGTNLTNDMSYEPLQIVIKMIQCNGQPVAKVSDSSGKEMCEDQGYIEYLKSVFQIGVEDGNKKQEKVG